MKQESRKPFFARFLEGQEAATVKTGVKSGKPEQTLKYPSDGDEI